MRLQSIIIDGFKSYAHRQELGHLDPHFNAITGLNGSGKSNIFDAICFVMGISNLKKVRAEDPSELIFKNGQAGIQRASVTIEFLNNDRRTAPQGYSVEEYPTITISRQIITGGRQKFFLNGRVSDQSKVKQFFHACNLNVDNPHFLVLQGTVHKLVNMRSAEILGLLEEAAGTRVFDARRRNAESMIVGKEKKVEQLNQTIDAEIGPMLLAMKDEQEALAKYVAIVESLDAMKKFRTAHAHWTSTVHIAEGTTRIETLKRAIANANATIRQLPDQKQDAEIRVETLRAQVAQPRQQIVDIEQRQATARKELSATQARIAAMQKNRRVAAKNLTQLEAEAAAVAKKLADFLGTADAKRKHNDGLKAALAESESDMEQLKESIRLQRSGIRAGLNGQTLEEEANTLGRDILKLNAAVDRGSKRLGQLRDEMGSLQVTVSQSEGNADKRQKELLQADLAAQRAEQSFAAVGDAFQKQRDAEEAAHRAREDHRRAVEERQQSQMGSNLALQYTDVPGYDFMSCIYGRIGELVRVTQPEFSAALSAGIGPGKLFRVVVSDDEIAQALIEKGRLRNRVTFVPLRVEGAAQPQGVDPRRIQAASDIASQMGGWAKSAMDMITFDPMFHTAIVRQFADLIVCSDVDVARAIANDRRCGLKSVTADADIVEPNGAMTGGSKHAVRDVLKELADYSQGAARITSLRTLAKDAERRLGAANEYARKASELRAAAEEARAIFAALQHEIAAGRGADAARRLQQCQRDVEETQTALTNAQTSLAKASARMAEIQASKHDDPILLERNLMQRLAAAEKRAHEIKVELRGKHDEYQSSESMRGELEQRKRDCDAEMEEKSAELSAMDAEERNLVEQAAQLVSDGERLATERTATLQQCAALDASIEETEAEMKRLIEQEHELTRRVKEHDSEARAIHKGQEEERKAVTALERANPWILEVRDTFGPATGEFYFEDITRSAETLRVLKESEAVIETMGRKVNRKVNIMFDMCKQEYEDLIQKRETLRADRDTIFESIKDVEEHKWSTLDALVEKVSEGFSRLFAACLPHASARLVEERDPHTKRLTGVAVKVAFNGKEKESLTELSGGQRSLLALCLILAILRFRPAPVYILDEVDAALDPSHTQNIGKMLRDHFADAQFLLVSLKDGMFSNANVIYQVRNTQGYSEVTRVIGGGGRPAVS